MPPTSTQALQNVQNFQSTMQSPNQIAQETEQGLGIPGAQQQVSGLRQAITSTTNLLNNVAPSVMGRTGQSLVTSAQANRQIANEQAPISKTLSEQTSKEGQAASDLQSLLSKAGNLTSLKVQGQQNQLSNLENIYKDIFGSEQAAASQKAESAKQAEQVRQFNADLAEKQRQANMASTAAPSAQDIIGYFMTAPSKYGDYNPNGTNYHRWQAAEQEMIKNGIDVNAYKKQLASAFGSVADKQQYGVAGF